MRLGMTLRWLWLPVLRKDNFLEHTLKRLASFICAEFASGFDETLRLLGIVRRRLTIRADEA